MGLAFFLAVTHLEEVWLSSHSLQGVHCVGSRAKSCVSSECVDVYFKRLLFVSGNLGITISRFNWIRVWVQKEKKSTSFACISWFPLKCCNIKRVAKLALKDGRHKLVTKSQIPKFLSILSQQIVVPLIRTDGNQRRWRKVSVSVWF